MTFMLPVLTQQNVHFRRLVYPRRIVGHLGLLCAADRADLIRLVADGAAGCADIFVLAKQVRFLNPEVLSHIRAFHAGSRLSIGDAAEISSIAASYSVRYGRTTGLAQLCRSDVGSIVIAWIGQSTAQMPQPMQPS